MSEGLVHIEGKAIQPQDGGLGIDFSNRLFQLKPATLAINQRMTQAEGAIPGKFRVVETGEQFDEVSVALLGIPTEGRQYHVGEAGQLNRKPENLMCFSTDCVRPHIRAKIPQAVLCEACPKSSWDTWRKKFEETGIKDKTLIPPCDHSYKALLIDTNYKLPMNFYIRGGENKDEFERGMKELSRKLRLLKSQGHNPNIFDLRFTMKIKTGKQKTNYVLAIDGKSIRLITDEERAEFGGIYQELISQNKRAVQQQSERDAQSDIAAETDVIDAEVIESTATGEKNAQGEIII